MPPAARHPYNRGVFGIGGGELMLIAFVALIVFGPQRIPELARAAARGYRELSRLRRQVDDTLDEVKRDLRLDEDLITGPAAPLIRPPQGERGAASASTVAAARHSPGMSGAEAPETAALSVPAEDDYLNAAEDKA